MNYLHTMSAATFVVVKQDAIITSEALNKYVSMMVASSVLP